MQYSRFNRRSLRLRGYDYRTPGAYFITICAYQRQCLFRDPVLQEIITTTWHSLSARWSNVRLNAFVVMPNHVHGIVWIDDARDQYAASLTDVVGTFKSLVAISYLRWVREHDPQRSAKIWQRNYYERVIRNERELANIREYIHANPERWAEDRDNLDAVIARMRSIDD